MLPKKEGKVMYLEKRGNSLLYSVVVPFFLLYVQISFMCFFKNTLKLILLKMEGLELPS